MRVKTAKYNPGNIGSQEGPMDITFSGPLFLHADPVQEKHAVTKQYVDARFGNLDAGDLKTDVLPTSILPAFDGDVNSSQGSNVFTLSNTGVTPGTYTKVTVDLKGRVVSGGSLANEDVPNLSWSKMVRDKPTTLNGYGITDAVPMSGGTVGSAVKLNGLPSDELHVSNRQYLDNKVEALGSTASPGTVFRFSSDKTPEGFLRCSGGELDKASYPTLYSVIGDKYAPIDYDKSTATPWENQYTFNDTNGNLGSWTKTTSLPADVGHGKVIVIKNKMYRLGGLGADNNNTTSNCFVTPLSASGTIGTWSKIHSLPEGITGGHFFLAKNRLIVLIGKEGHKHYYSVIDEEGNLGEWLEGGTIPNGVNGDIFLIVRNRIHLIDEKVNKLSFTALIKDDGSIGDWGQGPSNPFTFIPGAASIITNNHVYLTGGYNGSAQRTVFTSAINKDGTLAGWTYGTPLPSALYGHDSIVTKNRVYLIAGFNPATQVRNYVASINSEGVVGAWSNGPSLPVIIYGSSSVVTGGKVYRVGGSNSSINVKDICVANFTGGSNDYSEHYTDYHYLTNNPTKFKLPDHTHLEDQNTYYYIRY